MWKLRYRINFVPIQIMTRMMKKKMMVLSIQSLMLATPSWLVSWKIWKWKMQTTQHQRNEAIFDIASVTQSKRQDLKCSKCWNQLSKINRWLCVSHWLCPIICFWVLYDFAFSVLLDALLLLVELVPMFYCRYLIFVIFYVVWLVTLLTMNRHHLKTELQENFIT